MAMSIQKREEIAASRIREIQEAAIKIFDEKGYVNTTIANIARAAGISNGLIYHYFSSKKEILMSYGELIRECEQYVLSQPTPTESLLLFSRRVLLDYKETGYHAPIRILITCYIQGELGDADLDFPFNDYGKTFLADIIRKGQETGEFRSGDPAVMGDIFWHMIIGYTIHRINYGRENVALPDMKQLIAMVVK
ncbi:MAG: TetR/AcrR family transcriptional regulator [Lachnospiraceae bacterium]|nr:TetR/AcrR family transcriptional regulator [Lachnospiraceae bacterium]